MSAPLRVAVLGRGPVADEWEAALSQRSLTVRRTDTVGELLAAEADYGLVCVEPRDLVGLAAELAPHPVGLPVVIVLGGPEHPHGRFLLGVLQGKREWEQTFDAIADPLALLATDGRVLRANLGWARVLGRAITEVVGQHYQALLGAPPAGSLDPIERSLADGAARTEEARYASLPGVQQVTASPLRDAKGGAGGLVVLLKDMTGHQQEQERLQRGARLADIGQLAAGVAHEINTPLASIALRAESLLKVVEDPRLQAVDSFKNFPRYLKTIDEETFRCKKIIGALLEFSAQRKPETRQVDLNTLASRAADLIGHQMKLKRVELSLRLDPALAELTADDGQLRQVLIALLMNALDASQPGGHVEVATRRSGKDVVLTVSDDGAGIPEEIRAQIFNPFFTTKAAGQGTGLGLAICHGIVASHGGRIEVESEAGRGTRVHVTLPARPPGAVR